jgi:hypothetical protein
MSISHCARTLEGVDADTWSRASNLAATSGIGDYVWDAGWQHALDIGVGTEALELSTHVPAFVPAAMRAALAGAAAAVLAGDGLAPHEREALLSPMRPVVAAGLLACRCHADGPSVNANRH